MILDILQIAAEAVALMQHRRMPVGEPRAFVEIAAGHLAEAVEMRLDMTKQRIRQVEPQQIGQRRIRPVEIHPGGVRREQARLILEVHSRSCFSGCIFNPCSFRPGFR